MTAGHKSLIQRAVRLLRWRRASYLLLASIAATLTLMVALWWPLVGEYFSTWDPQQPFWSQLDWPLGAIFAFMVLLIMREADLHKDGMVLLIGLGGGLLLESWGTRTHLWTYYTQERPPLWILPAWPIASLAIDRLRRLLGSWTAAWPERLFSRAYWPMFGTFFAIMFVFVRPTLDRSFTVMALATVALLALTTTKRRLAVQCFAAGAALGYFLEYWGTTRECWTYYNSAAPPLFAVLAHGVAAVAFWRAGEMVRAAKAWTASLSPKRLRSLLARGTLG